MTRVAFLSDVHGNAPALDACLRTLSRLKVDSVYFLGDAVGYLPGEIEVLDRLRREGISCQQGNHEAMMLRGGVPLARDAVYRLKQARERLERTDHLAFIATWPTRSAFEAGGKRYLLVHGSPSDELFGYVYEDSDLTPFLGGGFDVCITANTHRPWIRRAGDKIFLNTGSVGLPRDQGDLAAFAVVETGTSEPRILRASVDVEEIVRRYGDAIAPEVAECFRRKATRLIGEVVQ